MLDLGDPLGAERLILLLVGDQEVLHNRVLQEDLEDFPLHELVLLHLIELRQRFKEQRELLRVLACRSCGNLLFRRLLYLAGFELGDEGRGYGGQVL